MNLSDIQLALTTLFFAIAPTLAAWPLQLKLGRWLGLAVVALLFGALGYLWIEDFGATLGAWALLLGFFIDPRVGMPRRLARRRVASTPVVRAAQVSPGAVKAVEGRVVAGPEGTVPVPVLGGQAVWVRVVVLGMSGTVVSRQRRWRTEHDVVAGRPFFVDDGSARVRVELGDVAPWVGVHADGVGLFDSPSPQLRQFLASCGVASTELGLNRKLQVRISALRVGDAAYASGLVQRDGDALVLQAPPGDGAGIVVGAGTGADMLKRLRGWRLW